MLCKRVNDAVDINIILLWRKHGKGRHQLRSCNEMAEDLQTHLDKYLPQLLRSHRLLPPQGESLSQVQLLTVQQATSGDQSSHGMHGDQGSVGVQAPAPGVEAVVRELSPGHQAAAMVVGLLKTNNCGELTLEDNTGKANCEVRGCSSRLT